VSERDYISRTIATVRNHRDADNCWPQWANTFADEIERMREALRSIEETARWYADNGERLPLEVDHALCVEVLDLAQRGLGAST
jgi:uncharacterized protein YjcR